MKIITITLNPAFDVHCSVENLELYKENYAKDILKQAGGKGINISHALAGFGIENTAFAILGKENGEEFLKELEKDGVLCKAFYADGRIRENITLHSEGGETRISFEGFSFSKEALTKLKSAVIKESDENTIITFTGRLPKGLTKQTAIEFLWDLKNTGAKLVVDCNSFEKEDLFEIKPFLIKPNEQEAAMLFGLKDVEDDDALAMAEKLFLGGVENVIISLGADGLTFLGKDGAYSVCVPKICPVSTIGAGDSLLAGFIFGYSENMKIEDILKHAAAFSVAACLTSGTNPPIKENVEEFFKKISVKKL